MINDDLIPNPDEANITIFTGLPNVDHFTSNGVETYISPSKSRVQNDI